MIIDRIKPSAAARHAFRVGMICGHEATRCPSDAINWAVFIRGHTLGAELRAQPMVQWQRKRRRRTK